MTFIAYIREKWLVGDILFYMWPKPTHPLKNANFLSIFAPSALVVIPTEKVQLTEIGSL